MPRYSNKKRSKNKFLKGVLVVGILVALFFISFWITSLVLDANQKSKTDTEELQESATPKPTYEELEEIIEEKDKKIEELEEELEKYKSQDNNNTVSETQTPSPTPTPATTQTPTSTQTPKPSQTPAPKPTEIVDDSETTENQNNSKNAVKANESSPESSQQDDE